MQKPAYLIMAHGDWTMLSKLLQALDDPRNDLYIHIDQKVSFDPAVLYRPLRAGCSFIPRRAVTWGGDSMIRGELELMKAAAPGHYAYYHLLSGADMPLRRQDDMHRFFAGQNGTNFIKIDHVNTENGSSLRRIRKYRFFQNYTGQKEGLLPALLQTAERISMALQELLGVDRLRDCPKKIYKGSNWFSITDAMVQTVLGEEPFIRKYFTHSLAADEMFLQTVAMNSPLRETVADEYLRYIDWERGAPYVFRTEDYEALMRCGAMFARKFSDRVDPQITDRILKEVTEHE